MQGNYFLQKSLEDDTFSILPLFGNIKDQTIKITDTTFKDYIDNQLQERKKHLLNKISQQKNSHQIISRVVIEPLGFKKIKLTIEKVQLNIFLEGILKLITVVSAKEEIKNIEEEIEEPMVDQPQLKSQEEPNQVVEADVKEFFIVIFHPNQESILVSELNLQMIYVANYGLSYKDFLARMEQQKLKISEAYEINQTKKLCIDLKGISVSVSKVATFNCKTFHDSKKNRLILPLNIFLSLKGFNALTDDYQFYEKSFIEINIEEIVIKFSLITLGTFQSLLQTTSKELDQIPEQEEEKKPMKVQTNKFAQVMKKKRTEAQHNNEVTTLKLQKLAHEKKQPGQQLKIRDVSAHLNLQGFQFVLVTQNNKTNVPSFQFSLNNLELYAMANMLLTTVQFQFWIEMRYLNLVNSRWEPVIETTALNAELSKNPLTSPLLMAHLAVDNSEMMVNIPTQMIAQVFQMLKALKDINNMKESGIEENVSPYLVQNWTGYTIEIRRDFLKAQCGLKQSEQVVVLKNGDVVNYQIESNEKYFMDLLETVQEKDYQNLYLVQIKILDEKYGLTPLKGINLDQIRTKKYVLTSKKSNFVIVASCEIVNNSKVFTLSSELVFENKCQSEIELKLEENDNTSRIFKVAANGYFPVPFDLLQSKLAIKYSKETEQWSEIYLVNKIVSSSNHMTFNITFGKKEKFLCLTIQKQIGKTYAIIEPPVTIKNCLGIDIEFKTFSKVKELKYVKLNGMEEYEECAISLMDKLYLSLQVMGLEWTKPQLFYSDKDAIESSIRIVDKQGNSNSIEVFTEESFSGGKNFTLYAACLVLNQTGVPIILYGQEKGVEKKEQKKEQKKNQKKDQKMKTVQVNLLKEVAGNLVGMNYIIVGEIYSGIAVVAAKKREVKEVAVVQVDAIQETTLRIKIDDGKILECLCKVSLQKVEGIYVLMKKIELKPKYVI